MSLLTAAGHAPYRAVRTQRLLDLMTMDRRGLGQFAQYAKWLRLYLETRDGSAPLQRVGVTGGPHLH